MPKKDLLVEKVFTTRKPRYNKKVSPNITQAELEINEKFGRTDIETTADPAHEGEILALFLHGFAASKYCWLDPDVGNMGWVKDYLTPPPPRDFGWHIFPPPLHFIPVDWTLSQQITPLGATEIFDKNNIEWLTYSQESAFGVIDHSVKELTKIIEKIRTIYGNRRIIIIAHSRGGLLAKSYLDKSEKTNVEKLVTFGTPFGGTFMSAFDTFRTPSKYFLNSIRTARTLWDISHQRTVENIATKQLAPGSSFLKKLCEKGCRKDVRYVNVAGSCSHITNLYSWHWSHQSWKMNIKTAKDKHYEREELIAADRPPIEWYNLPSNPYIHSFHWIMEPRKIMEIYPKLGYPEVLQGDGAVSVRSALFDHPDIKHYIINKNHIDMTCCDSGFDIMLREVKQMDNE
ncbi:MAG: esterase/lipase family protein [Candidatus Thorarchaeota archaeon]